MAGTVGATPTTDVDVPEPASSGEQPGLGPESHRLALTVVLPCFNEEDNVEPAYHAITAELTRHDLEVLFVDDGSTDGTLEVIRRLAAADARVAYLSLARNYGFEAAFSAGFRYARHEWCLQLDADLQFPPAEAHKLIARAMDGYDAVYGVRERRHDSLVRRAGSTLHHLVASRLLGIPIPRGTTTFRVVRTAVARRIVNLRQDNPYFMATLPSLTDHYTTVRVDHRPRERGRSKFRLIGLSAHALRLFFGYSGRIATAAALGATLGALGLLSVSVLALVGLLGGAGQLAALLAAQGLFLLLNAVIIRYVAMGAAGQRRPVLFCVREANIPVDPADHLYGPGPGPHPLPEAAQLPPRHRRPAAVKGSL